MFFLRSPRAERGGLLVWAVLLLLLYVLPEWLRQPVPEEDAESFRKEIAAAFGGNQGRALLVSGKNAFPPDTGLRVSEASAPGGEAFPFDPNEVTEAEMLRLGLSPNTIRSILRYREKGGKFRKKEDFGKIYTLPKADYERLLPFIRLGETAKGWPQKSRTAAGPIDINQSEQADWEGLPGIGPSFAARIIRYREALGGFVGIEQVGETFGFPDSVFLRIKPFLQYDGRLPRTLDPNTATVEQLEAHPYISGGQAGAIVRHRERTGIFATVEQVQILSPFKDSKVPFAKIKSYLRIQ